MMQAVDLMEDKNMFTLHSQYYYTPAQRSWRGVYWIHLVRPSVCPSVCRRHGFRRISQVCFGISISNFICMLMVAIGRSLLIFSDVTFKMAAWRPYWIFWFPDSNFIYGCWWLEVRLHGTRQAARLVRHMLQRDLLRGNSVYLVGSCSARLLHIIHVSAFFGVGVLQRKLRQLLATACATQQL